MRGCYGNEAENTRSVLHRLTLLVTSPSSRYRAATPVLYIPQLADSVAVPRGNNEGRGLREQCLGDTI